MIDRDQVRVVAAECGFGDVGFTTADPFDDQRERLEAMCDEYAWAENSGLDLRSGTDPSSILPGAKSIIVLMEVYFARSFPRRLEKHFGRCYLDDDRVTRDGLAVRIKKFRSFLRDNGIDSKVPFNLPHRVAAARAGLGDFGKNCLFYSNSVAGKSSWVLPVTIVTDHEFLPDEPTGGIGCPDWCRNACVAACPTRALKGNGTIDPRRCISYMTYYGEVITPRELREPMGLYVYGCDRCQDVCPRNAPWLAENLPLNEKVVAKEEDLDLEKLLLMDKDYFLAKVWPQMFYMGPDHIWKWKMNVARVMGNSGNGKYLPALKKAFPECEDPRARGMIAWALGRIGGGDAKSFLEEMKKVTPQNEVIVHEEIEEALKML